jgi:hypothetical protein
MMDKQNYVHIDHSVMSDAKCQWSTRIVRWFMSMCTDIPIHFARLGTQSCSSYILQVEFCVVIEHPTGFGFRAVDMFTIRGIMRWVLAAWGQLEYTGSQPPSSVIRQCLAVMFYLAG